MTKFTSISEKVVVTFFEAVIAYVAINQTSLTGSPKAVAIGAVGFALSAVYNILRESTPTMPVTAPASPVVVVPASPAVPVVEPVLPSQPS